MNNNSGIPAHAGIHCLTESIAPELSPVDPGVRRDDMREVSLNGQLLNTAATSLQALLMERGYDLRAAFACALNAVFVPRARWSQQPLQDGDRVDVVTPITGG